MSKNIRFSIVCPVYNAKRFLEFSVNSILNQTYSNWELIIIDDGSTDGSGEICDLFAKKDERIKVIHQANQGQSIARLNGIEKSVGDYVVFLDSDDLFETNALSLLVEELNNNAVDILLYNARKKKDNEYEDVYLLNKKEISHDKKKILCECFAKRTAGYFWTYCFKKELFNVSDNIKNTYSKIKYSEDAYLIYQIIKNNVESLAVLPLCLYVYNINDNSITHTQTANKVKDRFDVFNNIYFDLYKSFNVAPAKNVKASIGWTYLSYLRRVAKEYDYPRFKDACLEIRESFLFKKMSSFKKDKLNSLIHFLLKIRMYKKAYSIIRAH